MMVSTDWRPDTYRPRKPGWVQYMPDGKTPRCQATNKQGMQCGKMPSPGAQVCRNHGGAAPQVKRKAELRLLELVNPAIATIAREMTNPDNSGGERLRAAENVLDRTGYSRKVDVSNDEARVMLLIKLQQMAQQGSTFSPEVQQAARGLLQIEESEDDR